MWGVYAKPEAVKRPVATFESKRVRPSHGTVQNGKDLDRSPFEAVGNNVRKSDQLACAM